MRVPLGIILCKNAEQVKSVLGLYEDRNVFFVICDFICFKLTKFSEITS